jgi:hypothetical protein
MQAWAPLYSIVGAGTASLLGLLFVAVSINAASVLGADRPVSRGLAEQAFRSYVTTIFVSLVALFPGISLMVFARVALAGSASSAVLAVLGLRLLLGGASRRETRWRSLVSRLFSATLGYGLLIEAELRMAFFGRDERNTLAAGALVLLFSATLSAWDLLKRIAADAAFGF